MYKKDHYTNINSSRQLKAENWQRYVSGLMKAPTLISEHSEQRRSRHPRGSWGWDWGVWVWLANSSRCLSRPCGTVSPVAQLWWAGDESSRSVGLSQWPSASSYQPSRVFCSPGLSPHPQYSSAGGPYGKEGSSLLFSKPCPMGRWEDGARKVKICCQLRRVVEPAIALHVKVVYSWIT